MSGLDNGNSILCNNASFYREGRQIDFRLYNAIVFEGARCGRNLSLLCSNIKISSGLQIQQCMYK